MLPSQIDRSRRYLARRDPTLKPLLRAVGKCTLTVDPDGFSVLVRSIVSQQISSKAAASISVKLIKALGGKLTARRILNADDSTLRGAGLSQAKMLAIRDLSERVASRSVRLKDLVDWEDREVIEHLLPVRGIGPWTAEMFLIFSLGRMDVLPVADLGLRAGVQRHYGLKSLPDRQQLTDLAEPWRPYRTIATWYIWRSLGAVPQSS